MTTYASSIINNIELTTKTILLYNEDNNTKFTMITTILAYLYLFNTIIDRLYHDSIMNDFVKQIVKALQ